MATQVLGQSASSCFFSGNSDMGMAATTNMYDLSRAELAAPQLFMLADVALTGEIGGSSCWDYQVGEERQMAELSTVHDASFSDGEGDGMAGLQRIEIDSQGIERVYMEVTQNHREEANQVFAIPTVDTSYTPRITEEKNKYSKSKPFRCKPCQFVAGTEEEFVDHIKVHSAKKVIVEEDAEKRAQLKESETSTPEESDLLKGPIRCERCGYNTSRYDHYVAHLKHHEQVGNNERVYSCPICTYTTVSVYHWKKHLRNHFPRKVYTCHECSYFSDRKNNYIQHIRTHTGERPYRCFMCNYQSSQKTHLTRHMRIHSGEKPFKCDLCNYVASNQHEVTRHVRQVHNGPKPLICPHCDYKTADRSNYKKHVELHVSPRQFICPVCQYAASKKCNLQYHIKSRHYNCSYITMDVSRVRLRTKKSSSGDLGSTFIKNDDDVQLELMVDPTEKQPDKSIHQEDKENCSKPDKEDSSGCVRQVKAKKRKSAIKSKDDVEKANKKKKEKPVKPRLGKRRAETETVTAKGDEKSLGAESGFMKRDKQMPESFPTEKELQDAESVPLKVDEKKAESVSTKIDKKKSVIVSENENIQKVETVSKRTVMKKAEPLSTEGDKSDSMSAKEDEPNGEAVNAKGKPNKGNVVCAKGGMQKGESVSAKEDQQKGKTVSVKGDKQNGEVNAEGEKQKDNKQKAEAVSAKRGKQKGKKQKAESVNAKLDKQNGEAVSTIGNKQIGEAVKAEGRKQKGEQKKVAAVSAKENKQNSEAVSVIGDRPNGEAVSAKGEKAKNQKTEAVPAKGKKQKVESVCAKAVSVILEKHNGEAVNGERENQKGEQQKIAAVSAKENKQNSEAVPVMELRPNGEAVNAKGEKSENSKTEAVSANGEKLKEKKQKVVSVRGKAVSVIPEKHNGEAVNGDGGKQKGEQQKAEAVSPKANKPNGEAVSVIGKNQKAEQQQNTEAVSAKGQKKKGKKQKADSVSAKADKKYGEAVKNEKAVNAEVATQKDKLVSAKADKQINNAISVKGVKPKGGTICAKEEKQKSNAVSARVENQKPLDLSTKRVNQKAESVCRTEDEQKAERVSAATKEDDRNAVLHKRQLEALSSKEDEQNVDTVSKKVEKQKGEAIDALIEAESIAPALAQKRKLEEKSGNAQIIKMKKKEAVISKEPIPCLKKSERLMKKNEQLKRANQVGDVKQFWETVMLKSPVKNKVQTRASKACSRLLKDSELNEVTLLLGSSCTLVDHTDKDIQCQMQEPLKETTVNKLLHLKENKDALSEHVVETCPKDDDTNNSKTVSACAAVLEYCQEQPLALLTKDFLVEKMKLLKGPEASETKSIEQQIKDQMQAHTTQQSIEAKRCAEKHENSARILVQHREDFVHAAEALDSADRTAEQQRANRRVGAKHKQSAETHAAKRRCVAERTASKLENSHMHAELQKYSLDMTTEAQKDSAFKLERKRFVCEVHMPLQKDTSEMNAELQMEVSETQVGMQNKVSETNGELQEGRCAVHSDMQMDLEMDLHDEPLPTEQPKNKTETNVQLPKDIQMHAVQQKDTSILKLQKKGAVVNTQYPMANEASSETQNDFEMCIDKRVDSVESKGENTLDRDLVTDQAKGVAKESLSTPRKPGQDTNKTRPLQSSSTRGRTSVAEIDEDEGIHSHDGSDISDNVSEGSDDSGLNSTPSIPELTESKPVAHTAAEKVTSEHFVCIFCDRSFKLESEYSKHLNRHLVNVYYIEKAAGVTSKPQHSNG